MKPKPSALRFFFLVLGPTPATVVIALAVVALGVYLEWTGADGVDQAVAIALFLQLFAASTGYRDRLRRGHFDPVLVSRPNRCTVALAHWTVSVAPGLIVWTSLGAIDLMGHPSHWPTPLTGAGILVVLYASTMTWALSLGLVQYAGAVLWLALLFALGATQHLQALRQTFNAAADTWPDAFQAAASAIVCPIFLMVDPAAASGRVLALAALATVAVWAAGFRLIRRLDGELGGHHALNHVTLSIAAREIVGMVGPNGAGTTTLLRVFAGLVRPSAGNIRHDGHEAIRYFGGEQTLPPHVSARRWAALWSQPAGTTARRLGVLSRGTRQRIGLEAALAKPGRSLVLLDEPWEGLDPEASRWLSDTLMRIRDGGGRVVVSSHRIHDLASVCDRCEFLIDGRMTSTGVVCGRGQPHGARVGRLLQGLERARGCAPREVGHRSNS